MCARSRWALIEHPRSTGGRGVHAGRAAWVWGRGPRALAAGERRAGGGRARRRGRGARAGRAARGCVSSLAPALAGWRAPPLPSRAGNPGRVVAAAAYVSAVSRRGRAGRPGGRERSLGGRAAAAERGGGPRRAGGGRGSRSREPSRAVRGGAARPVPPLVAGRGELREDLAALQPGDWGGGPGTSHALHARGGRAGGPGGGRRRGRGRSGHGGRCGSGRAGREGGGCAPSLPPVSCLVYHARQGIPSPTLSAGPESPLRRRVTCPLPDPFRLGGRPSRSGAPRVPARSAERPGGRVPGSGTRGATHPPPRGLAPTLPVHFCPSVHPPTSFCAPSPCLSSPAAPGAGTVGLWGPGRGVCHVQTISKAAFSSLPGSSGLGAFTLGRTQKSKDAHLPGDQGAPLPLGFRRPWPMPGDFGERPAGERSPDVRQPGAGVTCRPPTPSLHPVWCTLPASE